MKKIVYLIFAIAIVLVLTSSARKSSGPPGCHAGEAPHFQTCVRCHDDRALNSGNADIFFDLGGAETGYNLGQTYTITIAIKKTGMLAAGFQAIALQENNLSISPGTVTITDNTRTQTVSRNNPHAHGCGINDKVWIEHKFLGTKSDSTGESKWTYEWTAPDTSVGDIAFYIAALEADNDLTADGDYTYTRSIVSPGIITSNEKINKTTSEIVAFPNPANNTLYVLFEDSQAESIALVDMQGKTIKTINQPMPNQAIDISNVNSGIYMLILNSDTHKTIKKVAVHK